MSHVYGYQPVEELIRASQSNPIEMLYISASARRRCQSILEYCQRHQIPVKEVESHVFERLLGKVNHQGLAAKIKAFQYADFNTFLQNKTETPGLLLALDQVQDPQNVGAIMRSALAMGVTGILLCKDRACDITPAVIRASAGAALHLPVAKVTNLIRALKQLKEASYWVVGSMPEAKQMIWDVDLKGPTVLLVGNEGSGLRQGSAQASDHLVRIPMSHQIGSLNVASSTAMMLYEAMRQRLIVAK